MKTYSAASEDLDQHIAFMRQEYHPALKDVWISGLFVHDDEHGDSVLKHNGYPAAAVVSITPLKLRALGLADAVIVVDRAWWLGCAGAQKNALIDHELQHLDRVLNEATDDAPAGPKFDSIGRPVLAMRMHDRQFGWFDEVAKRHGKDSVEVRQAQALVADAQVGQLYFDFVEVGFGRVSLAGPPPAPPNPVEKINKVPQIDDAGPGPSKSTGEASTLAGLDAAIARDEAASHEEQDAMYPEARDLVVKERNTSISHLQRRLMIGYNRAARLLERMEADGILGPATPQGPRPFLSPSNDAPVADSDEPAERKNQAAEGRKGTLRLDKLEKDAAAVAARHPRREPATSRRR